MSITELPDRNKLYFTKPYILVTRIGENDTNNPYLNPVQKYYEFDSMSVLYKYASRYMKKDETPLTALRVSLLAGYNDDDDDDDPPYHVSEYFHDFPTALQEYKDGIRV